jgi:hypothetical protein
MRKIPLTLLIVLSSILFTSGATAQNQPLACQGERSAGLNWENGRWVTSNFLTMKFILVKAGNTLTIDSVTKAINGFLPEVTCKNNGEQVQCNGMSGNTLFFDTKILTGGIAKLYGSTNQGNARDSVSVEIFSCTPF